jgi:predicted transcriptional regulator YdeE
MPEFSVKIVERPAVKTAGLKIHTTMDAASTDCPKLWAETFTPHMEAFPCDGSGISYGVSSMTSEFEFDYWAVMPLGKDAKTPAGLEEVAIPGGTYAECPLKSLAEMGDAYMYLYGDKGWGAGRTDYAVNFQGASLELYNSAEYLEKGTLTLLIPLIRK